MLRIRTFSPKNQAVTPKTPLKNERGNVIFLILIAIGLFAALSFSFSKGNRGSTTIIDKEQATLIATEIINYARSIKNAVHELQINGCDDTEISFENGITVGYENPMTTGKLTLEDIGLMKKLQSKTLVLRT